MIVPFSHGLQYTGLASIIPMDAWVDLLRSYIQNSLYRKTQVPAHARLVQVFNLEDAIGRNGLGLSDQARDALTDYLEMVEESLRSIRAAGGEWGVFHVDTIGDSFFISCKGDYRILAYHAQEEAEKAAALAGTNQDQFDAITSAALGVAWGTQASNHTILGRDSHSGHCIEVMPKPIKQPDFNTVPDMNWLSTPTVLMGPYVPKIPNDDPSLTVVLVDNNSIFQVAVDNLPVKANWAGRGVCVNYLNRDTVITISVCRVWDQYRDDKGEMRNIAGTDRMEWVASIEG